MTRISTPTAAAGTQVAAFADGLDHPRWLYVLPNGDVLVAETNAPPKPDDAKGIRGWVMEKVMGRAGAGVPSPNRITLLRDADHDGVAETRTVFLENLNSPFGMALVGNDLYVADSDKLLRFPYQPGETAIKQAGTKVVDINPVGRRARVQPGVRNLAISQAVAPHNLYYAPDPSSQIACSIGGNVAENAGGVHCLKYGLTVHNLLKIEVQTLAD